MVLRRNTLITWFVICWTLIFQYEALRANYLSPIFHRNLPKLPLLFPPAGWIMFSNVDRSYGFAEVYGVRGSAHASQENFRRIATQLNPHDIFQTKAVGYDNVRRNILVEVTSKRNAQSFCRYLRRKFPNYNSFIVVNAQYPDLIQTPGIILRQLAYRCQ